MPSGWGVHPYEMDHTEDAGVACYNPDPKGAQTLKGEHWNCFAA